MSYQVLARKWRPASFAEVVGQEHVLKALVNALGNNRLHHAYLFTGTRGVGKTTLARIFAKCLNCEQGVTATPCGKCSACVEIREGRFVDLIEVDAASRTKVDDTRELLDNVQYAPARGRFKVYLIDEVHMLSTHSFNALLKTLEEPPPHIKFLLATTDPQKLPVTVLSRCLQLNLKQLPEDQITGHLNHILSEEKMPFEAAALRYLAHAAEGSLRDALSLMDQAIAYSDSQVSEADVVQMLGAVSQKHLYGLLSAIAKGDVIDVMQQVDLLATLSPDYDTVIAHLLTQMHDLALAQYIPGSLELRGLDVHEMSELANQFSAEDLQLYYEILVRARRDLPLIPNPRNALEMACLRMLAFQPKEYQPAKNAKPEKSDNLKANTSSKNQPDPVPTQTTPTAAPASPSVSDIRKLNQSSWETLVPQLKVSGMAKNLANQCTLHSFENDQLTLSLAKRHESLLSERMIEKLSTALSAQLNQPVKIKIQLTDNNVDSPAAKQQRQLETEQQNAEASIAADPIIAELTSEFDAKVIPGSVKPIKPE